MLNDKIDLETPVLIVGGGPVGLSLAVELGWRNVPCVLVERTDGQINTPKMNEVNIRSMEFCRRWGIAEDVLSCPYPEDFPLDVAVVTRVGGYELGRIERPARKDQRPSPFSRENLQVCSQIWFDPMLRKTAAAFPTVQLIYDHTVESFEQDEDGVTAIVVGKDGERRIIRAGHMAACDGAGSRIRSALGVELEGSPALSSAMYVYLRADNLMEQLGVERPATFFAAIDREGYWGNIRAIDPANGLWRILFDAVPDTDPAKIDYAAWVQRSFAKPIESQFIGASQWTRRGVVAARFSTGRVHLVGDAAHQLSPTGGLGMNTGICDAVDLGWKLAAVHDGWGGPKLIDSYDSERRQVGLRNVAITTSYYQDQDALRGDYTAIDESTPAGDRTRSQIGPAFVKHLTHVFTTIGMQIGFRYADSPICVGDGTPEPADEPERCEPSTWPGSRAPHAFMADGRSTLDLFGRGYVLMRLGETAPSPEPLTGEAQRLGIPLTVFDTAEPAVTAAYERQLVLVRPDGHVAWRADTLPDQTDGLLRQVAGWGG